MPDFLDGWRVGERYVNSLFDVRASKVSCHGRDHGMKQADEPRRKGDKRPVETSPGAPAR